MAARGALISLFVLLLTVAGPNSAQQFFATDRFSVRWLDVSGTSLAEVRKELIRKGPQDRKNTARYGETNWTITWKFINERGVVRDIRTDAAIDIVLPRLDPESPMPPEDRQQWISMYRALLDHEMGHAAEPHKTCRRIERLVTTAAAGGTLTAEAANRIIARLIAENNRWDTHFDGITSHGARQGVTLLAQ